MPVSPTGRLPGDHPVHTWHELCLFLGGDTDSFTGRLLELIGKADPANKAALRRGFPRQVAAWEMWTVFASDQHLTAAELAELIDTSGAVRDDPEGPDDGR